MQIFIFSIIKHLLLYHFYYNCVQEVKCNTISFDSHKNNQWASRLHVQLKFLQAIRKTMVRLRAQDSLDKLETLRKLMTPRESVEETISKKGQ